MSNGRVTEMLSSTVEAERSIGEGTSIQVTFVQQTHASLSSMLSVKARRGGLNGTLY